MSAASSASAYWPTWTIQQAVPRAAGGAPPPPSAAAPPTGGAGVPARVTRTRAVPGPSIPISTAAWRERSRVRPSQKGPRSLIRTVATSPLSRLTTWTIDPKGSVRWAAVIACMS